MKHLWEVDHPYHASRGCYYSNDCHQNYDSWSEFIDEWGESDMDYNLVYRWDWRIDEGECLEIFIMCQRKAAPMSVAITVTRSDEDAVIAWLQPRAEHMRKIWEPMLTSDS